MTTERSKAPPDPPPDRLVAQADETEQAAVRARQVARALDRLSAACLRRTNLEELLQSLLALFVEIVPAEVAVLRLREGDRLRSRAAIGLEEEVASGFSIPLGDVPPFPMQEATRQPPPLLAPAEVEPIGRSPIARSKRVRGLCCLPLVDGKDLVGAVYLGGSGAPTPLSLSEDDRQLLGVLSARTAVAIDRQVEHDALCDEVRARDDALGVVAHDLRNPISVIALTATSLLRRFPDASERRPIERIVRAAQRADRLIQDLLEISAIEGGRFSVDKRRVETADLVLAALESQQSLAADASIIIATDIAPDLPPIEVDEERLMEVIENLVSNAIKFTSRGGSVTVGASSSAEGAVRFWVKDSGVGIPAEQLPHLFDRFWQAQKSDRRGTGLGLSICKAIVEAHGGRIWAEANPGAGTAMFFTIPALAPVAPAATTETANILLVDDQPENLLALSAILERPGYRLVTATSGEEALRLALREQFAVALIDIAMPRMNGLEVAVHLKELERSRETPILFVTAFGDDPAEIHRAYAAGGADYLVKPLDAEIVRKKVAVFVALSRRRQERPST